MVQAPNLGSAFSSGLGAKSNAAALYLQGTAAGRDERRLSLEEELQPYRMTTLQQQSDLAEFTLKREKKKWEAGAELRANMMDAMNEAFRNDQVDLALEIQDAMASGDYGRVREILASMEQERQLGGGDFMGPPAPQMSRSPELPGPWPTGAQPAVSPQSGFGWEDFVSGVGPGVGRIFEDLMPAGSFPEDTAAAEAWKRKWADKRARPAPLDISAPRIIDPAAQGQVLDDFLSSGIDFPEGPTRRESIEEFMRQQLGIGNP